MSGKYSVWASAAVTLIVTVVAAEFNSPSVA
jgi:hypothetical protein